MRSRTCSGAGVFAKHGYCNTPAALADLVGWERFEARRRVTAADQVCRRVALDGTVLPPRLPATAAAFTTGAASLRHVEAIASVLGSTAAGRLTPQDRAGAETSLAEWATTYTPTELTTWGTALVETLDQDGPEPDDRPPVQVNEFRVTRRRTGGGTVTGRFDDPALYDAIATVIDATSKPLGRGDDRTGAERQVEALAEVCGYVLNHGDVPQGGGARPHLNGLIRLEDLESRARSAMLASSSTHGGGTLTPESLRMLACRAAPRHRASQPGHPRRTPPGGGRPGPRLRPPRLRQNPSWCEIHHILAWELDGETELDNLVMSCRAACTTGWSTNSGWLVRIRDGLQEFIPPRWPNFSQTPRRKPLPHLAA